MCADFRIITYADHFSICRPKTKVSRSFRYLTKLLQNISTGPRDCKALLGYLSERLGSLGKAAGTQRMENSLPSLEGPRTTVEERNLAGSQLSSQSSQSS